jgi:hypothetical protein
MDDYKQALELGRKGISENNPDLVASLSGAVIHRDKEGNTSLSLDFLNRKVLISWPGLEFAYKGSQDELPIQQQVLLVHYLSGAWSSSGAAITEEWIAFQDVPDGKFYLDAFWRRARDPLVKAFGDDPEQMMELSGMAYGAHPFDYGDGSVVVRALPLVPVALILWRGDEEFPPEGNILFDRNITRIFSAEDIAWLAGMVVYPLVGMAKAGGGGQTA